MRFTVIVGLFFAFGTGDSENQRVSSPQTSPQSDAAAAVARLTVQKPELQHVALLFRHTVRAPRVFPPNDSLLRPDLFPRGVERSTREGLLATRNTTLVWREWYKDFLTGDPNEVYARSSQADRCHETLAMVLDTWYPSPDDLPLSQVAIRMPPRGHDKYVENCGNMRYITRDYDPEFPVADAIYAEEGFRTVGDYVNFLRTRTQLQNESVNFFYMAYMEGFLSLDYEYNFTRRDHWMFNYPKTREFARLYLLNNSINVMAPYYAHYLMEGISNELEKAANGISRIKLSLFSFHDLNLLSVLRALGHNDLATDPLAAVALELWKNRSGYRVALRVSEGITTEWKYRPGRYIDIYNGTEKVDELSEILYLMRNFFRSQLNVTDCGYFGSDAKI
ncbi:uncharacterized protein LOC114828219 [Galendromus occidentalis]|uniref:acid phosphatase n=1 Tax=Galendromus occidentalis TaxID=34638 RepID=A0AAJ7SES1_9ACAR|nr:uncharacterized protein LOC114828219 [Galendromus occidentalis]